MTGQIFDVFHIAVSDVMLWKPIYFILQNAVVFISSIDLTLRVNGTIIHIMYSDVSWNVTCKIQRSSLVFLALFNQSSFAVVNEAQSKDSWFGTVFSQWQRHMKWLPRPYMDLPSYTWACCTGKLLVLLWDMVQEFSNSQWRLVFFVLVFVVFVVPVVIISRPKSSQLLLTCGGLHVVYIWVESKLQVCWQSI